MQNAVLNFLYVFVHIGVQRFDGEEYMVYIVLNHFDILCVLRKQHVLFR